MSSKNLETLKSFFSTVTLGDLDAAAQYLHGDFVAFEPSSLPWGGVWRGRDGWLAMLRKVQDNIVFESSGDEQFLEAPDTIAVALTVVYTSRATGASHTTPLVEIFGFDDGLVARIDVFVKDTHKLLLDLAL
jgi:ketosteroid isomerase-like protein